MALNLKTLAPKYIKRRIVKNFIGKKQKKYVIVFFIRLNNTYIEKPVILLLFMPANKSMWKSKLDKTIALYA